jgi:hypothetical protein
MAVAITTTDFPEGAGPDMYDGVNAELGVVEDPPVGLIFHWAGEVNGKWTISDVWQSRADYDRFQDERIRPAVQKLSGMDPANGPQPTVTEFSVHNYFIA